MQVRPNRPVAFASSDPAPAPDPDSPADPHPARPFHSSLAPDPTFSGHAHPAAAAAADRRAGRRAAPLRPQSLEDPGPAFASTSSRPEAGDWIRVEEREEPETTWGRIGQVGSAFTRDKLAARESEEVHDDDDGTKARLQAQARCTPRARAQAPAGHALARSAAHGVESGEESGGDGAAEEAYARPARARGAGDVLTGREALLQV